MGGVIDLDISAVVEEVLEGVFAGFEFNGLSSEGYVYFTCQGYFSLFRSFPHPICFRLLHAARSIQVLALEKLNIIRDSKSPESFKARDVLTQNGLMSTAWALQRTREAAALIQHVHKHFQVYCNNTDTRLD